MHRLRWPYWLVLGSACAAGAVCASVWPDERAMQSQRVLDAVCTDNDGLLAAAQRGSVMRAHPDGMMALLFICQMLRKPS